jgi:hypothetical protein
MELRTYLPLLHPTWMHFTWIKPLVKPGRRKTPHSYTTSTARSCPSVSPIDSLHIRWSILFVVHQNNCVSDTVHNSTYRKVRIFTLKSNKKSLCLNSIVDYLKMVYKKPNEVTAKVNAKYNTGWEQKPTMFGQNVNFRDKYALVFPNVLFSSFHLPSG